jgi:iron complex transport system permease protein
MRYTGKYTLFFLLLGLLAVCTALLALMAGPTFFSPVRILNIITSGTHTTGYDILFQIRMPRLILGFAVGGALSLAGCLLQGMFRNPLVEPYTLGISGGASLGVALSIALGIPVLVGIVSYPVSGFAGALLTVILVYAVSISKGVVRIQGLLLTGVMISFISSSVVMLLMSVSKSEELHNILFWIMGSLDQPDKRLVRLALIVSAAGLVVSYFFSLDLNALIAGEEEAVTLGVSVEKTKKYLFFIASILTGVSVSVSGICLVLPYFMRLIIGNDYRYLLISSFLGGGIFLILCDTLARTIVSPLELPVGVVTGIIGGCIFIYTLSKKRLSL